MDKEKILGIGYYGSTVIIAAYVASHTPDSLELGLGIVSLSCILMYALGKIEFKRIDNTLNRLYDHVKKLENDVNKLKIKES